mmetsp:Transcript_5150/g.10675  ORF Transcript_5150/g.10675 Transcript_5150/m.10675 type:complete len:175 (+) Transcript_5150:192-716(+)
MSKPRSRARVETVVFDEPSAPRVLREEANTRKRQRREDAEANKEAKDPREEKLAQKKARLEREATFDEVMELGASGMSKNDKKAYQAAKLARLGCKAEKQAKVPLKIMFSRNKTLAQREEKRQKEIKSSGVLTGHERKKRRQTASKEKRRFDDIHHWKDGNFHGGVLKIRKERK